VTQGERSTRISRARTSQNRSPPIKSSRDALRLSLDGGSSLCAGSASELVPEGLCRLSPRFQPGGHDVHNGQPISQPHQLGNRFVPAIDSLRPRRCPRRWQRSRTRGWATSMPPYERKPISAAVRRAAGRTAPSLRNDAWIINRARGYEFGPAAGDPRRRARRNGSRPYRCVPVTAENLGKPRSRR
jgi:hypothetical protein